MNLKIVLHTTYHIPHTKYLIVVLIFILDRYFKDFSSIDKTINTHYSFSLTLPKEMLFVILLCLLLTFIFQISNSKLHIQYTKFKFPLFLILVGGISNLIDRILYNGVVDYINFFGLFKNNLADFLIGFGLSFVTVIIFKK